MSSLDTNSKRLLERHPSNPSSGTSLSQALDPSASAKSLFSRSATAASLPRTTLKETIAARKREAAASRGLPNRPESAQATFSPPVKHTHSSSTASTGLASAPMRPARAPRRPDIIRPATAEPLASRQLPKVTSPGPSAPAVPASVKSRLKNENPNAGSGKGRPKRMDRANTSPAQSDSTCSELGASGHVRRDEELTMVIPRVNMDRGVLSMVAETESLPEEPTEPPPPPPSKMVDSGLVVTQTAVSVESTLSLAPDPPDRLRQDGLGEHEPPALASDQEIAINGSPSIESTLVPVISALRVYEDPNEADEGRSSPGQPTRATVLEERTVNEPVRTGHSPLRPTSASSTEPLKTPQMSPRKKMVAERPPTETPHGRRLLHASLGQIKAGQIDVGSLQTLQNAVDCNRVMSPDAASFNELLWALLHFSPTGSAKTGGENNVEEAETHATQLPGIVRDMLSKTLDPDPSLYADVIKALLRVRRQYDSSSSSVVDAVEETAERYGSACSLETCMDAVLDALASDTESYPPGCVAMGFDTLAASLRTRNTPVTQGMAQRLGSVAARYLDDLDPALRQSVFTFCVALHDHMEAHPHFWRVVRDTREDQRALINYRLLREEDRVNSGSGVIVELPR